MWFILTQHREVTARSPTHIYNELRLTIWFGAVLPGLDPFFIMKGDLKATVSIAIYSADNLSVLQITIPSFPTSHHLDKLFFFFPRQLSVSLSLLQAFFITWSVWKYKPSPGLLALVVFLVPPLLGQLDISTGGYCTQCFPRHKTPSLYRLLYTD